MLQHDICESYIYGYHKDSDKLRAIIAYAPDFISVIFVKKLRSQVMASFTYCDVASA